MAEKIAEISEDSNPNLHLCEFSLDSKNLGSPFSLSVPSEPPDIRNWFSSYIYESPELDTQHDFKCSVSGENKSFNSEENDREKEENLGQIRSLREGNTSDFDEKISFSPVNKGNKRIKSSLPIMNISENESLEGKSAENSDLDLLKDDLNSWLNNEGSLHKSERKSSSSEGLLKMQDCEKDHIEGTHLTKKVDYYALPKSNVDLKSIKRTSPQKLLLRSNGEDDNNNKALSQRFGSSNGEEGEGKSIETNGFISTKKNKDTYGQGGRPSKRSQENQVKYVRNTEKVLREGRRPLSERNNFEYEVEEREMVGKWRCPQKSKPELGPPLKQLRLEHWVRRL